MEINVSGNHQSLLTEVDQKNTLTSSFVLLALAIIFLLMIRYLQNYSDFPWVFIIPALYCIASLLGLFGCFSENPNRLLFYQISLWVLLVMNGLIAVLSILYGIFTLLNPYECDRSQQENCSLFSLLYIFALIRAIYSATISSALIPMMIVFLRFVSKFKEDKISRNCS